jgi:hypothetical protein
VGLVKHHYLRSRCATKSTEHDVIPKAHDLITKDYSSQHCTPDPFLIPNREWGLSHLRFWVGLVNAIDDSCHVAHCFFDKQIATLLCSLAGLGAV